MGKSQYLAGGAVFVVLFAFFLFGWIGLKNNPDLQYANEEKVRIEKQIDEIRKNRLGISRK